MLWRKILANIKNKLVGIVLLSIMFILGIKTCPNGKTYHTYIIICEEPLFIKGTPEEYLMEALIYYDIKHPEIVYAQAICETGNFTSNGYKNKNNLFGIMKGTKLRSFNHWTESIVFYKEKVQNRYKSGDYYIFLEKIGYAEDIHYTKKLKQIVNEQRNSRKRDTVPSK